MKKYFLSTLFIFYSSISNSISLSEEFKANLCDQLINTHVSSVPSIVQNNQPSYRDASNVSPVSQSCTFFNETDISVQIALDFDVRHYTESRHSLDANMECYFTSQYEWNCGYTSIRDSEVIVLWTTQAGKRFITEYKEWTDMQWQSDLLSLVETQLNENY